MKHRQLADLINIQSGYAFKSKEYTDSGHFLVRIGNVQDGHVSLDNPKFVALDGRTERFALREGDFLTSLTGNIGRVARVEDGHLPAALNQRVARLTVADPTALHPDYFFYFLSSDLFREELCEGGHGAAQQNVSPSAISKLTIPVPPLPEQQRIVGILDEAFEGIATAKANAEKNLQNARALFESHLHAVFTQRGEGWVEKHLKDVCEKITDGTHQTPTYYDEGVVFLSSRNVTSGRINWDNIKYIDTKQHLEMHKRVAPRLNDILLAKNGTTGVAAIVDRDVTFDIYVSLALLRSRGEILPQLLLHFINSPVAKEQFNKRLKGIGVPNLHLKEIREVVISFPEAAAEQEAIATNLDHVREATQRLATIYERKLAALDDLKKSLLHQAFTGEL